MQLIVKRQRIQQNQKSMSLKTESSMKPGFFLKISKCINLQQDRKKGKTTQLTVSEMEK